MKSIWKYLSNHVRQDFQVKQYLFIFLFLALAISINYQFDFNDRYLDTQTGLLKFLYRFLFFSVAYYLASLITAITREESHFFFQNEFWIKSILAIAVLSLDSSLPFLRPWIDNVFNPSLHLWVVQSRCQSH